MLDRARFKAEIQAALELVPQVRPLLDAELAHLALHAELLAKWNKTHNLTSMPLADWPVLHYVDSLLAEAIAPAGAVIDVGSGAGFPAVAWFARRREKMRLIEKVTKKRSFLQTYVAQAGVQGVVFDTALFGEGTVVADDGPHVFTSRATFDPAEWLKLALAVAKPGDHVVVQSAQDPLPGTPVQALELQLPYGRGMRRIGVYAAPASARGAG